MNSITPVSLAKRIDHTLLRPDAKVDAIHLVCDEALQWQFYSVCIEPQWLPVVAERLRGTEVKVVTVIDFPKGGQSTEARVRAVGEALKNGACEIDIVLGRERLVAKDYAAVERDLKEVMRVAGATPVKVILETSELTDPQKAIASALVKAAGAAFVKTSTGFSAKGATVADVQLMRSVVGEAMGVKASGGIRDYQTAVDMIMAGATRLGTSASVSIVQGAAGAGSGY